MTGDLSSLVPFGALVAFAYYVVARAEITRWFWEGRLQEPFADYHPTTIREPSFGTHVRRFLDRLLSCPLCSGFWIGFALGWAFDLPSPWKRFQPFMGGVYGLILNPIIQGAMHWLHAMEHAEAMDEHRRVRDESMDARMDRVVSAQQDIARVVSPTMGVIAPDPAVPIGIPLPRRPDGSIDYEAVRQFLDERFPQQSERHLRAVPPDPNPKPPRCRMSEPAPASQLHQAKSLLTEVDRAVQAFDGLRLGDLLERNRRHTTRPDHSIDRNTWERLEKARDLALQLRAVLNAIGFDGPGR